MYLGASAVVTAVAAVVLRLGWGNAGSRLALHGPKMLALDVVLLAAAAYGVVHAMGLLRAFDTLPWRAGTYLFPGCVVDARGPVLNVWSVGDAESIDRVSVPSSGVALCMRDGTRVVVPASSPEQMERASAALGSVRSELARAIAEDDPHMLAELDPLHDSAVSNPIGPTASMKRSGIAALRFGWAIAVAAGLLLGLTLGNIRNRTSDDAMIRAIGPTAGAATYRTYLSHGGRHSDAVRDVLLPRAELREAQAEGTVEAIQSFASSHPASKIAPEIDTALRAAMLVDLAKAKAVGTVSALDAFAKKYPDHKLGREIASARHALFVQALEAWKKTAHVTPQVTAFMGRLVGWTEKNGPACEVRFRLQPSKTMDDADKSVQRSVRYPGVDALPSKYMTATALVPREQRVGEALAQSFAAAFPADVIALRAGAPLDPDAPTPTTIPILAIDYAPEWSRGDTACAKPSTVFAGIIFAFEGVFALPDGAPLKVSSTSWRGAETWRMKRSDPLVREEFEQAVYDSMIDGAFDQLGKRLSDTFF